MKKIFYHFSGSMILVFSFLQISFSQNFGEIKYDFIRMVDGFDEYSISYEYIYKGKYGFEIFGLYDKSDVTLLSLDTLLLNTLSYGRTTMDMGINYRQYFNNLGKKFFIGPHFKLTYQIDIEGKALEDLRLEPSDPQRESFESGFIGVAYGLNFGYKWIFKEKFVIDPLFTVTASQSLVDSPFRDDIFMDFNLYISFGYRFSSSN